MYRSYAVLQESIALCPSTSTLRGPPRPEALLDALMKLQNNVVSKEPLAGGIPKNRKQPQPDRLAGQRVS